jgi:hypothetical protein
VEVLRGVECEAAKEDRPIAQLDRSKLPGRTGQQFRQRFALRGRNQREKLLLVDEGQVILDVWLLECRHEFPPTVRGKKLPSSNWKLIGIARELMRAANR